jgi:hypothetical protein
VIQGVECFDIRNSSDEVIGRGWFAKTQYLASLPMSVRMRGIRVRQGNIEVGDEHFLKDAFSEQRFATWHIGEIHLGSTVKTNARRDGFEQSSDLEAFLERANSLGRHLSRLCRSSSTERSLRQSAHKLSQRAESLLAWPFLIDKAHFERTRAELADILSSLRELRGRDRLTLALSERLAALEQAFESFSANTPYLLDMLDGRSLRHLTRKKLLVAVARQIVNGDGKNGSQKQLLQRIIGPYLKRRGSRRPEDREWALASG